MAMMAAKGPMGGGMMAAKPNEGPDDEQEVQKAMGLLQQAMDILSAIGSEPEEEEYGPSFDQAVNKA
jgi:hypothetical protein